MKTFKTLILFFGIILFTSFSSENNNDKKLVGIWKGFEVEKQYEGVEKHWIVQRFANGTYVIMFTTKQNCEIQTFTEKGKWWTKGNLFYEKHENGDVPEIYSYEVKDDLVVHFKNQENNYEFDDYKID